MIHKMYSTYVHINNHTHICSNSHTHYIHTYIRIVHNIEMFAFYKIATGQSESGIAFAESHCDFRVILFLPFYRKYLVLYKHANT